MKSRAMLLTSLVLQAGLAFSFLYAAVSSLINPASWIGFLPFFLQNGKILVAFSFYQLALAIWIISGKRLYESSVLSSLTLAGIIAFNLGALEIIFRDIPVLASSIALALISKRR